MRARLDRIPADDVSTTIVSFQEQVQGWMAFLSKARTSEQVVHAYAELDAMWRCFCRMSVVSFTPAAQKRFEELRRQRVRLPTLDLRIASIALATGSTLLSRNLRDFRRVPGFKVEDWTQ